MNACAIYPDLEQMKDARFCGQNLGDYTHDELVQMLYQALHCQHLDLAPVIRQALAINARRRAADELANLPFISRRKGGCHDAPAR